MARLSKRLRVRALLGSLVALIALGVLVGILLDAYHDRGAALHSVIAQEQALRASARLRGTVVDIETGVRGYQLTRQPSYLQPERAGVRRVVGDETRLRRRAGPQLALAARISGEIRVYVKYGTSVIAEVASGAVNLRRQRELAATGKMQVDQIRADLQRFDTVQQGELTRSEARATDSSSTSRTTALWVVIGLFGVLALYGLFVIFGVVVPLERRAAAARREALEAFNADLRAANEDLEAYAYVTSHDLGEPLRTMAGFAELLERRAGDRLGEEERGYIGHIITASERMRALIDDLLAFARSGGAELEKREVDTGALVRETVERLQASGRVHVNGLPRVAADPVLLTQLFQNLIVNALKFAPDDTPVLVGAQREDRWWRFDVRDEGIGIAPEHAELIFGMFKRLHAQDRFEGTGMGLAISQRIVERHGGRIWVTPAEGGGSVFSFTLPIEDHS